jgi:hypothetical protein
MREDFKKFEAMLPAGGLVWDSVGAHQGVVLQARYRVYPSGEVARKRRLALIGIDAVLKGAKSQILAELSAAMQREVVSLRWEQAHSIL